MKRRVTALVLSLVFGSAAAEQMPPPIIDMHAHAMPLAFFERLAGPAPIPHCVPMTDYPVPDSGSQWGEVFRSRDIQCNALWSPATDDEVMQQTLDILRRYNITAVTGGPGTGRWRAAAGERIIPSFAFGGPEPPSVEAVRQAFDEGRFAVFGEVSAQYGGVAPDDASLEPYWALLEELDVPVGIHIGTGPLGAPYLGFPGYRGRLHSPLLLEDVLVRHPDLRVYIMHAGWPMLEDLLAVLWTHPQVYAGVGVINWALPREEFHAYLERIVRAGFGKRVLFGSDQMVWPEAIERAIEGIESAGFLSAEQKRDIFFNNAARFLRLTPQQVVAMKSAGRE